MRILVINGPNLNLLGVREPDIYGRETYADLLAKIQKHADARGVEVDFVQSNHEGALVDAIQSAFGTADGIIIKDNSATNAGGGVYADDGTTIKNCNINNNTAGKNGGGVYAGEGSTLEAVKVMQNSADENGGGVYAEKDVCFTDSGMVENNALENGGGLYAENGVKMGGNIQLNGNTAGEDADSFNDLYYAAESGVPVTVNKELSKVSAIGVKSPLKVSY